MKLNPYYFYMAEHEGMTNMISTRLTRLNALKKELKNYYNITEDEFFNLIDDYHLNSITQEEYEYLLGD